MHRHPRHLALVGPTASGKSELALELARRRDDVELVSVDSMQVYRGMDIGTAKPSRAERDEIPHHLIDVADPAERFTVTRFAALVAEALTGIEARGHRAVLVGGTGLYLQAALGDLHPPGEWPAVRAELEARVAAGEATPAVLYRTLAALDPAAAERIEPGNVRRVLRALEVTIGSGVPFSAAGPGVGRYPPTDRFAIVGVWLPRGVLGARIDERVRRMLAAGLVEEVGALAEHPGGLGPTARQALGYKEVLAHLEEGGAADDLASEITRRTRAFARRQRSWFRRDPRIHWHGTAADPMRLLPGLLAELDGSRA